MVIEGRLEILSMDQVPLVYKVDNSVQSSLSSSLVLLNTRLPLNPTLRVLSYNTNGCMINNYFRGSSTKQV